MSIDEELEVLIKIGTLSSEERAPMSVKILPSMIILNLKRGETNSQTGSEGDLSHWGAFLTDLISFHICMPQ